MTEPLVDAILSRGVSAFVKEARRLAVPIEDLENLERNFARNYFRLRQLENALPRGISDRERSQAADLDQERARIARELHSGAGQALAGIKLQLELLHRLPETSEAVRKALQNIAVLADEALVQVRGISHQLHPPDWERLNLGAAIQRLWIISGIPERYEAELEIGRFEREPRHAIRRVVYRVAQEAISNIIRHSGATRVSLTLAPLGARLQLEIADNGKGFEPADNPQNAGLGLQSMREQVRSVGGEISIRTGAQGTQIAATTPV